jgi:hypothetical protein
MLPAHLVTTHGAPAHPHPVLGHLRSWQLGEFRRRDEVDALLCQQPATGRAPIERHRHLHGGLGEGLRRRGFTVTKRARARLASRRLGVGHPRAPENGVACRFPPPLSCSISTRKASWLARHSVIWRCSATTNASSSSRLNAGRSLGSLMGGTINPSCEGRKSNR